MALLERRGWAGASVLHPKFGCEYRILKKVAFGARNSEEAPKPRAAPLAFASASLGIVSANIAAPSSSMVRSSLSACATRAEEAVSEAQQNVVELSRSSMECVICGMRAYAPTWEAEDSQR